MTNVNHELGSRSKSPYSKEARLAFEKKQLDMKRSMKKPLFTKDSEPAHKQHEEMKDANNVQKEEGKSEIVDIKSSKKKNRTIIYSLLIIILLVIAVYIVYNIWFLKQQIIVTNTGGAAPTLLTKNIEEISTQMVSKDGDTRINIVIAGIGGKGHKGGSLTDSLQVLSIDPFNNKAAVVSLPRDFYLTLSNKTSVKLNTVYQTGDAQGAGKGGALLKDEIGKILDLKIHYFINIDFAGFEQLVDSLGGVTINVDKAINDPYYPDEALEGYEPFHINAGKQMMNGKTALKYARSRKTTSDFDRSRRQQQLIVVIKDKALSLGVLANPAKISEIVKIIGSHIKTDIQLNEMQELAKRYKEIQSDSIESKVIDNSKNGPLADSNQFGGYGLIPKLGLNKFDEVQNFAHTMMPDPKITSEKATIEVKYIKSRANEAQQIIDKLTSYGYIVTDGGFIKNSTTETDSLIARTTAKPFTQTYLTHRYPDFIVDKQAASENESDYTFSLVEK